MSSTDAPRRPKTFRLPLDLIGRLEAASLVKEVPQTEIVEKALRRALGAAEEGPAAGPLRDAPSIPRGREGQEPSMGESRAAPADSNPAVSGPPASPQPRDSIGVAGWLAGRIGMPHALCRSFVKAGRVTVGGEVYRDEMISQARLLDGVTLDGEAV